MVLDSHLLSIKNKQNKTINHKREYNMITIEYRNKYVDKKRHLCLITGEKNKNDGSEIRLCDNNVSETCMLSKINNRLRLEFVTYVK